MKRVEFCLPADVNLGDMEWFEPRPDAKPIVAPVETGRPTLPPHEVERLCSDPDALRKFCAESQRVSDANKTAPVPAFADFGGALSGGAR